MISPWKQTGGRMCLNSSSIGAVVPHSLGLESLLYILSRNTFSCPHSSALGEHGGGISMWFIFMVLFSNLTKDQKTKTKQTRRLCVLYVECLGPLSLPLSGRWWLYLPTRSPALGSLVSPPQFHPRRYSLPNYSRGGNWPH